MSIHTLHVNAAALLENRKTKMKNPEATAAASKAKVKKANKLIGLKCFTCNKCCTNYRKYDRKRIKHDYAFRMKADFFHGARHDLLSVIIIAQNGEILFLFLVVPQLRAIDSVSTFPSIMLGPFRPRYSAHLITASISVFHFPRL